MPTTRPKQPKAATSFRAAFAEARSEGRPTVAVVADAARGEQKWSGAQYEVRIEKRLGSRAADVARWNKLGRKGWQLIAVDRKQAFFHRDRRPRV